MLRQLGVPLFDADDVVHRLLATDGGAAQQVAAAFPGVQAASGGIDRRLLGQSVFGDPAGLARLERIIHPMVAAAEERFRKRTRGRREPLAVLDIPLLFETGGQRPCNYVLVASGPVWIQRPRVFQSPRMTEMRLPPRP